ncbi:MAG: translocation/assembly module TamB domain-containing protein [Ferruginibacter sp.]|nr:translocation/assembly module TamB domain-containing protein [Ferruginibacter sp.]
MLILVFWVALAFVFLAILPASKILFVASLLLWALGWGILFKKAKHKLSFFLFLFVLVLSTWLLINTTPVQNWLVGKVSGTLSRELKTKVEIKHVNLGLFNKMLVEGVLVEDRKKDTLLYAGTLKVNITDWFFFKEKPVLQYIGLSDAVIQMNRTDSVWNYQFIIDYFTAPKTKTAKKNDIQIDLKILDLKNISFNRIDGWMGQDLKGSLKTMYLSTDTFDISKKIIAVKQVDIEEPVFGLYDYQGNNPVVAKGRLKTKITTPGQLQWNPDDWNLSIAELKLKNGTFLNEKETPRGPYTDRFDGQHIVFSSINGNLKNIVFAKDTLSANVKLSTREKSGFEVKQLLTDMKITPDAMEFSNLDILTGKSRIGNYYAMRYENFNADMSDFLHSIKLEGHFDNSKIHSDDIGFFAPQVKSWNRLIYFNGNAKGTIDNLSANRFTVKSDNSIVYGDIVLKGLPDINNTFIDFKSAGSQTNYRDITTLVPSLKKAGLQQMANLGNIRFAGNFTGFINDFVAYGNINTALGNLNADLNMKLPAGKMPSYSGKISSAGFQLGRLIGNNQLGSVALNGNVKGSGFSANDIKVDFNGTIRQVAYSGYNYQNITVNGKFVKSLFTGNLDIDDPNLKINDLNGSVSLKGDSTTFNFTAGLQKANLQQLRLTKGNFTLSGLLNFDFKGNNIDNFLGIAKMYNATLMHDTAQLSFNYLNLNSFIDSGRKVLSVESNEVEGNITGRFKILELPDAFSVFLNRYYPSYFDNPHYDIGDQDFSFLVKTKEVNDYVKLFDNRLGGFDNSVFSGSLRLAQNEFNITASVPQFSYDGKNFESIELSGIGNRDSLNTTVSLRDFALSDSLHFPNTKLILSSGNDISNIRLSTSASKTISEAELNAQVQTFTDGIKIDFAPSTFILNDKKWNLAKGGEITLRKSLIKANDVRFTQGDQEIVISTETDGQSGKANLVAKLKKVNINDLTTLVIKQPRLEGILTGTLKFKDPFGKQVIEFDAAAEEFRLDDKELGTVNIKGDVNTATGLITAKGSTDNDANKFVIDGTYNYKDSTGNQMDFGMRAEKFDIGILNNYLGGIFSDIKGDINTEDLRVYGGAGHNYVTGSVNITEGELKIIYTQCKYKFSNETIIFNPDEIDFGELHLRDTLNNTGVASGKLQHRFFNDFGFDNIRFETGRMLLLNTGAKDNSQFYGRVIGKATMTLNGPTTEMRMNITGEPSAIDSSHIFIPTGSSQEYGKINYIDFIQYGSKMEDEYKGKKETNFLVNMNLKANPACKIDVILDETTGDIIKGRGNGLLNISVGTREPLSIRGRYDITGGEYTFNFQTIVKKYFSITNGSSITWNGDPYLAQIDIDAKYLASKVDLGNLSPSTKQKEDVTIVAHLTGVLNKPVIKFDFELPPTSEVNKNFIAKNRLEALKNDENEMNKQVASLLIFNSFISTDQNQGFFTGGGTLGIATNTIGGIVSGWLTNMFNKELTKATNGILSTYFDINSTLDLQSKAALIQANFSAGFKLVLSSRLVVLIGGNLDVNNPYAQLNKKGLLTPDINIEWSLNNDGSLKVIGFNRTSVDLTQGQRNRSGVKLSYRKDFDRLSDIFAPSEERKRRRELKKEVKKTK